MDTLKYNIILNTIQKNEAVINTGIISSTSQQFYFKRFEDNGMKPSETVTNTFTDLLKVCLQMGDTGLLIDQYSWTCEMLVTRGVKKQDFIMNYCSYMETAKENIVKHITDPDEIILCEELFKGMKEEFLRILNLE